MVSLAVWWRMDGGRVGRVIESESPSVVSDSLWLHGLYTVHGIFYARMVEWAAFPFSRGSSQSRDQTQVSHIAGRFFTSWATREVEWVAYPSSSGSSQPNQMESKQGLLYCRWIFYQLYQKVLGRVIREFSSVQFSCSVVSDSLRPHELQHTRLPYFITNSRSLLKLMSIELVMPSNHLILCYPHLLPPRIFPSIRVFSNESVLHIRWPTYWSFSFSISPSNEYSGLISFRMDCLDLLGVQGTLKSLLQHHSSEVSILWRSAFFIVQLSAV